MGKGDGVLEMTDLSNRTATEYLRASSIPVNKVTLAACKAGIYGEMKRHNLGMENAEQADLSCVD